MFFAIFFLIYLAVAEDTGFGCLYVIEYDSKTVEDVSIVQGRLLLNGRSSVFNYYKQGVVSSFASGKYVSIDEDGWLFMSEDPDYSWQLSSEEEIGTRRILKYKSAKVFTACDNGELGLAIECQGAREVFLHYSDFAEY